MINKNPLSPHLSIHKKVMTALFSIFHRISGIGLSLGTLLIVLWIAFLALGPKYFNFIMHYYTTNFIFKIIFFIWLTGIFYHLFNGIRYLYWSLGIGMDLKTVHLSGYIVLFLTFISTIFVWFVI